MIRFDILPTIGVERIDPNASRGLLRVRARQVSAFMNTVHRYYRDELGLTRIDPDPYPSPRDHRETSWRISRFRASGFVEERGLEFLAAFHLDDDGRAHTDTDALVGLLVMRKPEGLCTGGLHTPTEILEWDVSKRYRRQGIGLGRFLLRQGIQSVHPEDMVTLDVAETNMNARAVYERYGFTYIDADARHHGLFDVAHLPMSIPAHRLQQRLGIVALHQD